MNELLRETRSVCPVCLRNLPARLKRAPDGRVLLEKTCPAHGSFSVPVWQGKLDFEEWSARSAPLAPGAGERCPGDCGLCPGHESASCCVVLEVTARCNLRCRFCFADGGRADADPPREELEAAIRDIAARCGGPLLQLSGGEPTLRGDLPALVRCAKEAGCSYVQLNTNGLRLAREPDYARALAEAGLDIVFLQFDGTRNEIYETLRGAPLLEPKLEAVRACADAGLGVTLVPTVVEGVNDGELGALVALAKSLVPAVRCVHFQPVSYLGRYPGGPGARYTLDRLMYDLHVQAGVPMETFLPSRCDHPLCGFHAAFLIGGGGELQPLSGAGRGEGRCSAKENRDYVARRWMRSAPEPKPAAGASDFDRFLYRARHESLTLSAMPFQDAENLNVERLRRCSLHVYDAGKLKPFCARYLSAIQKHHAAPVPHRTGAFFARSSIE